MICRNVEVTGITCHSGFLLWMSENCVSVMVKKQLTHVKFVLLDSHERNLEGRVSLNGVCLNLDLSKLRLIAGCDGCHA